MVKFSNVNGAGQANSLHKQKCGTRRALLELLLEVRPLIVPSRSAELSSDWSQWPGLVFQPGLAAHSVTVPNEEVTTYFALQIQGKL